LSFIGKATIGITDFAQQALGDIVYSELPDAGQSLSLSNVMCHSLSASSYVIIHITSHLCGIGIDMIQASHLPQVTHLALLKV
jgi:hypothetical protein